LLEQRLEGEADGLPKERPQIGADRVLRRNLNLARLVHRKPPPPRRPARLSFGFDFGGASPFPRQSSSTALYTIIGTPPRRLARGLRGGAPGMSSTPAGEVPAAEPGWRASPIPIRRGDAVGGWASADLGARLATGALPAVFLVAQPRPAVLAFRTG